jgi:hypothetical protein
MTCEDYPCCGHESGCCPDFDEDGKQINMKCTCGATVPLRSRFSICSDCMNRGSDEDGPRDYDMHDYDPRDDED